MQDTFLSKTPNTTDDTIETSLRTISQNILVFVFGLLPLFFLPIAVIPFDYLKTLFVIVGILLSVIFFSLTVLRSGKISFGAPLALGGLWLCAIVATVSSLLSGDMRDSFFGNDFGIHTALFVIILALVATMAPLIRLGKTAIMRLYVLLVGAAFLLGLFHIVRIVFGSQVLSFGLFNTTIASPLGGWNDLGLFFGLTILLSLVALEQLPLTKWGKAFFSVVVAIALVMLAVVNFFAVWIVLGLVSLMVLMYTLTKDRFAEKTLTIEGKQSTVSMQSVVISVCVFITSVVFVVGGGAVGGYISKITNISYVEVRPSLEATSDIARNVYSQNALLGIGPNKFIDAWRLYKDPSINQTVFWSTDFQGGSGYITTFFVTTGVLGAVSMILFFGLFIFAGFRMLFNSVHTDRFWYFIGSSSFVAALYLWGMTLVYIPSTVILLLAALFTGIAFTAYGALVPSRLFTLSIAVNKRAGFVLVGVVMVVIVSASGALYFVGQQYASVYTYGSAITQLQKGSDIKKAEADIVSAYTTTKNDFYALQLASFELAKINAYAGAAELTTEQQQDLQSSIATAIQAANIAVSSDDTDPLTWSTRASIYSILAGVSVEGAGDLAKEGFVNARKFDPQNPLYPLLQAQLSSRINDLPATRSFVEEAIKLKPNYTEALVFLTQIDIAEGKTEAALATTRAIVSLDPNNPARYYQLGVLESIAANDKESILAFERAVQLDTNYANARYQLARLYAKNGDVQKAVEHLKVVLALNEGNQEIAKMISELESGTAPTAVFSPVNQVQEPQKVTADNDAVTTTENPETSLISPVNVVANEPDVVTEETQAQ